jgi:signal transduction histidine kinase
MPTAANTERGPLVGAGLGAALLATLIAGGAVLGRLREPALAALVLGALSLAAALLPSIGLRPRSAALGLAWAWVVGGVVLVVALDALGGAPVALVAAGPLLALALLGRREALAAAGVALGATLALVGGRLWLEPLAPPEALRLVLGPVGTGTLVLLAHVAATLRTRATQGAREDARRARALLEGLPDTVLRLDEGGRLLDAVWRPPLRPRPSWRGRHLVEALPDQPGIGALLGPSRARRDVEVRQDGHLSIVEARSVRMAPGEQLLILRDVTEAREEARQRRQQAHDEERAESLAEGHLLQAGRLAHMGVLAAGVAHEINNPLAYVLGNVEYAREGMQSPRPPEDVAEALEEAAEGARRIRNIVEDIRLFSRADDSDHLELAGVAEVAASAVRVVRGKVARGVLLEEQHAPAPPVFANPSRLAQVVVNLLVNAAQAMPPEREARGHIVLRTGTTPAGEAFMEVRDDGVGIREEHQRRVFEPFFTTQPTGQGIGLGLSICYGLVRRLGGAVDVESEEGRGSTFRIRLPDGQVLLDAS